MGRFSFGVVPHLSQGFSYKNRSMTTKSGFYAQVGNLLPTINGKFYGLPLVDDYTTAFQMKVSLWKSIGMGVTEVPLPPSILASIKKEFPDDLHALKYVVFELSAKKSALESASQLEQILSVADTAKQYSLNQIEFRTACRNFCGPAPIPASDSPPGPSPCGKRKIPMSNVTLLPAPKPGLTLYRRDSRRQGSCSVLSVENGSATVKWHQTKKITKIATKNLRSPRLYSTKKVF